MMGPIARRVIEAAAIIFDVTPEQISEGRRRTQPVADARAVASWFLHRELGWSLPKVGLALCRHHTTVLHAVRRIDAAIASGHGPLYRRWKQTFTQMYGSSKTPQEHAPA